MRILTDNIGWKLLSLAVAVSLWLVLADSTEFATSIPAAVQYRNVPPELELNTEPIERLFLKVRGPATRLTPGALGQTALVLDLGNIHAPGEQTFTVGGNNLTLPTGVTLVRSVPSQVRVRVEKRLTRDVPVEVRFLGPPPVGYRISRQEVVPSIIRVVGPESQVQQLESVQTDPIDLSSKLSTTEFRVPVFISNPQVRCERDTAIVIVRISLEKLNRGQL